MTRKVWVLSGEGIECERESLRMFLLPQLDCDPEFLPVSKVLSGAFDPRACESGSIVFIPGGFSFADHFGSGRLLAYELRKARFLERSIEAGVHLMGVCNGFQVLTATGLFGEGVTLEPNRSPMGKRMGFVNRWIWAEAELESMHGRRLRLPVRHGEGRLARQAAAWAPGVKPLLRYRDPEFDNGSIDSVAGLWAERGNSRIVGLMPHPEIALRRIDDPDGTATEGLPTRPERAGLGLGDGIEFMKAVLEAL